MEEKIKEIADKIIELESDKAKALEKEILIPKLMRALYKELGEPNIEDYPRISKHISSARKMEGWTKYPAIVSENHMDLHNSAPVDWHIERASSTKMQIVERYLSDNWNICVYAYNVCCSKYEKHKDYKNIAIRFYVSRDCSKYEYVIVKED